MLKAIIFDFDGVIADTEPLHLEAFQLALRDNGIVLTEEEYSAKYLAYDDKTLFKELFKDRDIEHDESTISDLINQKSKHFENVLKGNILILDGVPEFISGVKNKYPLSIGSGALRAEIVEILIFAGLRDYFNIIVSADDVEKCKPDPEVYIRVLKELNNIPSTSDEIFATECLVIEDSTSGIKAAHLAGMKCLAVTNSYSAQELSEAELVVDSLKDVSMSHIEDMF